MFMKLFHKERAKKNKTIMLGDPANKVSHIYFWGSLGATSNKSVKVEGNW